MISEAFQWIADKVEAAGTPAEVKLGDMGNRFYALGGTLQAIPPPLPCREVYSLDDLVAHAVAAPDGVEIYYSETGLTLLPTPKDSRTWVHFDLSFSQRWLLLGKYAAKAMPMDQRDFVRLLQYELQVDSAHVTPFRKMDFVALASSSGEVTRIKDRMGREISASVASDEPLPDDVPITVEIFRETGERARYCLVAAVEVDLRGQRLVLLPDALKMAEIVEEHLRGIRVRLEKGLEGKGSIFYGEALIGHCQRSK